ncbi:unnamed protein product [Schistosoma curassoni]|uniref:Chromate transporter n=1 Tax=Schistosoma curassoni TaxID=6186 RepID=A0A183KBP2_9TREM|nr:unnamed protein product [Schistosoma curassoni]
MKSNNFKWTKGAQFHKMVSQTLENHGFHGRHPKTVFSYYIPVGSDMAWPSVLIPFGYIPASLLFLTAGATLATGLTNSELWQATSVVCCILPLITTIAIACTTLQQYMDTFPKNSSILIMGVISCLTSLLCFIHAILICVSQHFFHLP